MLPGLFDLHISTWNCSAKKDLMHVFSKISIFGFDFSRSLKCPLYIASYDFALRIGVSVMEL